MTTYYTLPNPGVLRFASKDRVDYLHRQTTNDIGQLTPDHSVTTVLTNPAARILDVFQLLDVDETILAITLAGRAEATYNFLRRRIFFNDDVRLTEESGDFCIIDVYGKNAPDTLTQTGLPAPQTRAHVVTGKFHGERVYVLGQAGIAPYPALGLRLLAPTSLREALSAALDEAGSVSLTADEYEANRIAAGIPGPTTELTDDYTPLETNLHDAISHTKGCYTGQEVIARQITYDKITRHMVGLRLDGSIPVGAKVQAEGKSAGTLTSVAESASHGMIALAVLKRPYNLVGTQVEIADNEHIVSGTVINTPII
jgi:folate-binding protein YgfZ